MPAGKRVLVVEDNDVNMHLALVLLTGAGYDVLEARTGAEGVMLAKRHLPDLVLMDIGLPDFSGLEATRMLKEDPVTQKIPVLALTAFAMKGDEERILAAGCNGYISKPVDTRTLLARVAAMLEEAAG
jgi:two-component system cell cycle response regulator DivK